MGETVVNQLEEDVEQTGDDLRDRPYGQPLTYAGSGGAQEVRTSFPAPAGFGDEGATVHAEQMAFVFAEERRRLRRRAMQMRADDLVLGHGQADLTGRWLDLERLQRIERHDEARGELELDVARREEGDAAAHAQLALDVSRREERQNAARGEVDLTRERVHLVAYGFALVASGVAASATAVSGALSAGLAPSGVVAAGAGALGTVATGTLATHRWRARRRTVPAAAEVPAADPAAKS
jgi:hypothetical protein